VSDETIQDEDESLPTATRVNELAIEVELLVKSVLLPWTNQHTVNVRAVV